MACIKCGSTNIEQTPYRTGNTKHQCNDCQWFWWVKPTSQPQSQQPQRTPDRQLSQPSSQPRPEPTSITRIAAALESIADALHRIANVQQSKYHRSKKSKNESVETASVSRE